MFVSNVVGITQLSSVLNPHADYRLQDSQSRVSDTCRTEYNSFSYFADTDPSVSTTNIHRIFTPDTETHVSAKLPPTPTSVYLLSPMEAPGCRLNTSPNSLP